ncbi:nucleolar protein 9 [Cephus cinctus]|uniref:Nucleolar protein 9 n=1 Tax=Cephus cinctus TaxID=211228 RepID=A0AAJ7C4D2_CEPCN|nr:nucleolar protein 9 [Cephus cinctus]
MADQRDNNTAVGRGNKRKKKKSFIQNAKKYARKGEYGHGSSLDSETYNYMVRILEIMRDEFAEMEDKLVFVNNVYEQTVGHEVEYARNQIGSRVLDSLIQYASIETIQRLVDAFGPSLRPICNDRFASHVLEKIIIVCADRGNRTVIEKVSKSKDGVVEIKDNEVQLYNDLTLKLCRYAINNMEDFAWEFYSNRVLRTVFEVLGGLIDRPPEQNKKKLLPCLDMRRKVVKEYTDLLVNASKRLQNWPQFPEFGQDELMSGLLQIVLYSLKDIDPELNGHIIDKIIQECFTPNEEDHLSNLFDTENAIRLLEACLVTAPSDVYTQINKKFFSGHLKILALKEGANFSVQRLLDGCSTTENFEQIFEELSLHYKEILNKGYTGVLTSLANACGRLRTKQGAFINSITKALGCDEPAERHSSTALVIATLKHYDELESHRKRSDRSLPINLHGSLIVQAILKFNKPIKIVNSLLESTGEDLAVLFSDPKGSRILDVFMESTSIGEKSREKLIRRLQGYWAKLACGIHGSRSLERMWDKAQEKRRISIMQELAEAGESLNSTKSGACIAAKLQVPLFARSRKLWSESLGKEEKTKAMFASIIESTKKK